MNPSTHNRIANACSRAAGQKTANVEAKLPHTGYSIFDTPTQIAAVTCDRLEWTDRACWSLRISLPMTDLERRLL